MLSRLKVDGFKNLEDVDIHFRDFTVITGPNGIGKSNLFDVIRFLSLLPGKSVFEAAKEIRGSERSFNNLFSKSHPEKPITIEVILVPSGASYQLGISPTKPKPTITHDTFGPISRESRLADSSTVRPDYTILSSPGFDIEVGQWHIFNLLPEYMRVEDTLNDPFWIGEHGQHIPGTLLRLTDNWPSVIAPDVEGLQTTLSNRLFELTGEIKQIRVRRSEEIESIWIEVCDPNGTWHNARALSDGTLRFLALAVLELDPEATGVFCIEEPENGIHPAKLPALVRLLRDIAAKPGCQVIVNTHSPALVAQVPAEDILVAYPVQRVQPDGTRYTIPRFAGLKGTWREEAGMPVASISQVMDYLDPVPQRYPDEPERLLDRPDARTVLERRRQHTWDTVKD